MNTPRFYPDDTHLRGLESDHLQAIEGNPLTSDELDMFAMFEREGWSPDRQRAYIIERVKASATDHAAE